MPHVMARSRWKVLAELEGAHGAVAHGATVPVAGHGSWVKRLLAPDGGGDQ